MLASALTAIQIVRVQFLHVPSGQLGRIQTSHGSFLQFRFRQPFGHPQYCAITVDRVLVEPQIFEIRQMLKSALCQPRNFVIVEVSG